MECKVWKEIDVNGDRVLIMGEGIHFYIRDELWDVDAMRVHMDRYHPMGRMFADRYCRTDDRVIFPAAEGAVAVKRSRHCERAKQSSYHHGRNGFRDRSRAPASHADAFPSYLTLPRRHPLANHPPLAIP